MLAVGGFLLTVELPCLRLCFLVLLLTVGALLLTIRAFLLTVELLCLQWEGVSKEHLNGL